MRAKTILIISLCILTIKVFSQNLTNIDIVKYEYYYNYEFLNDSTSRYSLKSQEMVLQVGEHLSKFTSANKLFSDSVLAIVEKKEIGHAGKVLEGFNLVKGSLTNPLCNYDVYKNYPEKNTLTFTARISKNYFTLIQKSHPHWELDTNNDSTILSFKCHKATTKFAGRSYIAWFTTDIPISDGPYKFSGLPGLIIKINDIQNQHCFTLIEVKKIKFEKPIFYIQKDYQKITPQEYVKALDVNSAKMLDMLHDQEKIKSFNQESNIKAENNLKSRNNFIERY